MKMRILTSIAVACALALTPAINAFAASRGGGGFGGGSHISSGHTGGFGRSMSSSSFKMSTPSSSFKSSSPSSGPYGSKPSAISTPSHSGPYGSKPDAATATPAAHAAGPYNSKPGAEKASLASGPYGAKPDSGNQSKGAAAAIASSKQSSLDRAVERKQSVDSLAALKAKRAEFHNPAPPISSSAIKNNPIASSYASSAPRYTTVNHYYVERSSYYGGLGYSRPLYVGFGSPYYGVYNSDFLVWAMINDAAFYHNHASDPSVIAWRRDYERLADQNAELKAQLAQLDAKAAAVEGPADPKYIPKGMKPEMMLADSIVTGYTTPKITFATGVAGSSYASLCEGNDKIGAVGFQANAKQVMDVDCVKTGGSRDNVDMFLAGKVPMMVASADTLDLALTAKANAGIKASFGTKQLSAFNETMWILVNKDSGINSIADLKPGVNTLYLGPIGSGTAVSYQNLAKYASKRSWLILSSHVDQYEKMGIDNKASYDDAIKLVSQNKTSAMLVMMPGYSAYMESVDREYGDKVKLVPVNARGFTDARDHDGNAVYHECEVSTQHYPKLMKGTTAKTLCVQAIVVVNEDWVNKNPAGADALITAWEYTKADVVRFNNGVH